MHLVSFQKVIAKCGGQTGKCCWWLKESETHYKDGLTELDMEWLKADGAFYMFVKH